jgi:two-component system LytT family response regulator
MEAPALQAYLVDDEPLAIGRLRRLLAGVPEIVIAGSTSDPRQAIEFIAAHPVDVLFLDIQMPGINGFELLARIDPQPFVIFTTAFDDYALRAFEVNSIDYLLKPVDAAQLARAVAKLRRVGSQPRSAWQERPELQGLLRELAAAIRTPASGYPRRIASRSGDRITPLDLSEVTHFLARDKLTYAVVAGREHCVDSTIAELEQKLDPATFFRIHRSVLLNTDWIREVNSWLTGRVIVVLKDAKQTQLPVARDRVRLLRERVGL